MFTFPSSGGGFFQCYKMGIKGICHESEPIMKEIKKLVFTMFVEFMHVPRFWNEEADARIGSI